MREQGVELGHDIHRARVELGAHGPKLLVMVREQVERRLAGDGLDAAGAGGDGHLGDDLDEADLARGRHVGAAAEFAAVAADVDHADDLAVLVAEEGEGALGLLVEVGLVGFDAGVVDDLLVHQTAPSRAAAQVSSASKCEKSKRMRSGVFDVPAWRTWVPRTLRSAQWIRCAAVW